MELTRYVSSQSINAALDVLVVKIETDGGLVGWGEVSSAPLTICRNSRQAPARASEISPVMLGRDPRQVAAILRDVSAALRGHGNAKTALEMVRGISRRRHTACRSSTYGADVYRIPCRC
ncbi:hypothetical protein [Mesorhizobium sp. M1312]|uniref:hypothetical protein n=1 Tax=unclassified Mesorhizobium TaxID=325217 RepID=UPI00333BFD8A